MLNRYSPLPSDAARQVLQRLPKSVSRYAYTGWEAIASEPSQDWGHISQRYAPSCKKADAWLRDFAKPFFDVPLPFDLTCSDDDLRQAAEDYAVQYRKLALYYHEAADMMETCRPVQVAANPARRGEISRFLMQEALRAAAAVGVRCGLSVHDLADIYQLGAYGALLKKIAAAGFDTGAMFRLPRKNMLPEEVAECRQVHLRQMADARFWRRWFRRLQERGVENIYRRVGFVHSKKYLFVSNDSLYRFRHRRAQTRALLQAVVLVNELGQEFSLEALAEVGNANPAIRRAELMVRIAGFEYMAVGLGHAGEFITITCPSRFHARHYKTGAENKKFDGSTPRDAAAYLAKVWARIRSALQREGICVYGFRVAEPHHDGTPHWHGLLFMPKAHVRRFRQIVAAYACADSRRELGLYYQDTQKAGMAKRREHWQKAVAHAKSQGWPLPRLKDIPQRPSHQSAGEFWADAGSAVFAAVNSRVDFTAINWAKGTAAGYIAKYIAKNIDGKTAAGQSVGGDFETDDLADVVQTSERVLCWASVHGIRQFQQIGGPPVTVWRELRRLDNDGADYGDVITRAALAADAGDWGKFVEVMGGVELARKDRPVQLYKEDTDIPTCYGAARPPMVRGVIDQYTGQLKISRVHEWQVVLKKGGAAAAWTCVNNCTFSNFEPRNARLAVVSPKNQNLESDGFQAAGSRFHKRSWSAWDVTENEALESLKTGAQYAGQKFGRGQIQREREQIAAMRNMLIDEAEAARQVAAQRQANIDDIPRQKYRDYLRQLDDLVAKSDAINGRRSGIIPAAPVFDRSQLAGRKQTREPLPSAAGKTLADHMAAAEAVRSDIADWLAELSEQDF